MVINQTYISLNIIYNLDYFERNEIVKKKKKICENLEKRFFKLFNQLIGFSIQIIYHIKN